MTELTKTIEGLLKEGLLNEANPKVNAIKEISKKLKRYHWNKTEGNSSEELVDKHNKALNEIDRLVIKTISVYL